MMGQEKNMNLGDILKAKQMFSDQLADKDHLTFQRMDLCSRQFDLCYAPDPYFGEVLPYLALDSS